MNVVARHSFAFIAVAILAGCGSSDDTDVVTEAAPEPSAAATAVAGLPAGIYGLDKTHAYISFSYSHLGFSNPVVGFTDFDATLNLDSAAPNESSLEVVVAAGSIYSRVAKFDEHLMSDELFDTANYPEITFSASEIAVDGDQFSMTGPLTIKGIAKDVTFSGTINKAADHPMRKVPTLGVSASATVNRSEWGLTLAVPAVGDEVSIDIEVEMPLEDGA
ncbi:MAG: YceI family protein [Pseudomonadota bacterium]